jgi:hypothetical protein
VEFHAMPCHNATVVQTSGNDSAVHMELKSFAVNHDIHAAGGILKEAPATFDELSALAVSQVMVFINKHCREARRWQTQSGNHKPFDTCCSSRPHLCLHHNSLQECGNPPVSSSLAVPKLPDNVKRSSLEKKTAHPGKAPTAAEKQKSSHAALDGLLEVSCSRPVLQ